MTEEAVLGSDETERALRLCLRDLTSLYALPAIWSGKPAKEILESLCQVLESTLPLDLIFASSSGSSNDVAEQILRVRKAWHDPEHSSSKQFFKQILGIAQIGRAVAVEDSAFGPMRLIRLNMGFYGRTGFIWMGSTQGQFPSPNDSLIMRAAVSLAAGALHTSMLFVERERAARAKDEFLAMLGHELRNPLSPIVTTLQLLKMKAGPQFAREQEIIERQVGQLTRLVDDLLDISRVTSSKIELRLENVSVREALLKAVETVAPLIESRRHLLNVNVVPADLTVTADLTRVAQIVQNLLINAAKYTDPNGYIHLRAELEGDEVHISVQDTGIGIDSILLPQVFDIFTQGATQLDRSRGGLGIGLALVKSLVILHGGRVKAESRGLGQGSTFSVWLPVNSDGPAESVAAQFQNTASLSQGCNESVLIVDDNQDGANSLADLLRIAGYEVRVAYDGKEALTSISRSAPEFAILDIGLPGMNGYELAAHIRDALKFDRPHVLALTGYGQETDKAKAIDSGFDHHFTKPIDIPQLLKYLQEHSRSRG